LNLETFLSDVSTEGLMPIDGWDVDSLTVEAKTVGGRWGRLVEACRGGGNDGDGTIICGGVEVLGEPRGAGKDGESTIIEKGDEV
jgi:hypothetical protein